MYFEKTVQKINQKVTRNNFNVNNYKKKSKNDIQNKIPKTINKTSPVKSFPNMSTSSVSISKLLGQLCEQWVSPSLNFSMETVAIQGYAVAMATTHTMTQHQVAVLRVRWTRMRIRKTVARRRSRDMTVRNIIEAW